MYSYLLYLSKLFKVKCGFDELDIFGRIGGTFAHFTYQYVSGNVSFSFVVGYGYYMPMF